MLGVSKKLALSIKEQTKILKSVIDKHHDARKEKRAKWSDLPDSTQNLILMASSIEGDWIPTEPTILCHKFYTKKVAIKTHAFLNKTLAAAGCIASIDSGFILALFSGSFVPDVAYLPAKYFIFLVPFNQPNVTSSCTQSIMLQLKVSHCQGWSEKDFKGAAKQRIQAPNSANDLVYQINNNKISLFFFSDDYVLTASLRRLH